MGTVNDSKNIFKISHLCFSKTLFGSNFFFPLKKKLFPFVAAINCFKLLSTGPALIAAHSWNFVASENLGYWVF